MEVYLDGLPIDPFRPGQLFITTLSGTRQHIPVTNGCDRCYNREMIYDKRLPMRPDTLCDECRKQVKLLNYITEEA